jgi:hypothetical protein
MANHDAKGVHHDVNGKRPHTEVHAPPTRPGGEADVQRRDDVERRVVGNEPWSTFT